MWEPFSLSLKYFAEESLIDYTDIQVLTSYTDLQVALCVSANLWKISRIFHNKKQESKITNFSVWSEKTEIASAKVKISKFYKKFTKIYGVDSGAFFFQSL